MLLFDEILQVVDSGNLYISGSDVNSTLLALFAELENLVGNLIVLSLIYTVNTVCLIMGESTFYEYLIFSLP